MVFLRRQLRDTPLERAHLPLGPPKILVVEDAEILAVRSLSLNPVVGAVVRYVKLLAQQTVDFARTRKRLPGLPPPTELVIYAAFGLPPGDTPLDFPDTGEGGTKPLTGSPSSKGPSIGGLFGGVTSPIFRLLLSRHSDTGIRYRELDPVAPFNHLSRPQRDLALLGAGVAQ